MIGSKVTKVYVEEKAIVIHNDHVIHCINLHNLELVLS